MNRIRRWPVEVVKSPEFAPQEEQISRPFDAHPQVPCSLFAPHHYEPNYAYPLLVWLHGSGDDERQLSRIMPHVSMRNYVAVGPRGCCPPEPGDAGYRWQQQQSSIDRAELCVYDAIEQACRKYHIAEDRIFLGGYQCGGTMALRIGMRFPQRFAGVMSIGGSFPRELAPLSDLDRIRRLPMFIAQGRDSQQYPLERSCKELQLFHAASLQVMLRQYPCGDDMTTQMLSDMDTWMMERINGVVSTPEEVPTTLFSSEKN